MSASSNSSRRRSSSDASHNDTVGEPANSTKHNSRDGDNFRAQRSDEFDADEELHVPSKFRKTMPSSSSPLMSALSIPLSTSMASITLSTPARRKHSKSSTSENTHADDADPGAKIEEKIASKGGGNVSRPMDMETALSILFLPQQSASMDTSNQQFQSEDYREYISDSKNEYIVFRVANQGDAPVLSSFIHKSGINQKVDESRGREQQKSTVKTQNEPKSKKQTQKNNGDRIDGNSPSTLQDIAALEMRLVSGLGSATYDGDDSQCASVTNSGSPPAFYSILVELHRTQPSEVDNRKNEDCNEQSQRLVGAALFSVGWGALKSCRYLDVIFLHVNHNMDDIANMKKPEGGSYSNPTINKAKHDLVWRRLMLRLSTLCLGTGCQSLRFREGGNVRYS